MKEHPNIEVEYVGIPWESAKEKFDVAIASDATPDVASMTPDWLKDFTNKGALMPLDDFIADWDEKDQMNENLDNINRQIVGDGKLYCTTYTTNRSEEPSADKAGPEASGSDWEGLHPVVKVKINISAMVKHENFFNILKSSFVFFVAFMYNLFIHQSSTFILLPHQH